MQQRFSELSGQQKAAETGGLKRPNEEFYSAACFRGGSSAPESWTSATW
jgi:hypothetical protein